MNKNSIYCNIYWRKYNIFPTTLPRTKWYATTILRLPRYIYYM